MGLVVWADIPVKDLARAKQFYSHILQVPVESPPEFPGIALPMGGGEGASFDLVYEADRPSTQEGTTVYLTSGGDIDGFLRRVVEAGGSVPARKEYLGPMIGWIAFFEDTEGNRIGVQEPGKPGDGPA